MKYKIWIGFMIFLMFFYVGVIYCYIYVFWEGKIDQLNELIDRNLEIYDNLLKIFVNS